MVGKTISSNQEVSTLLRSIAEKVMQDAAKEILDEFLKYVKKHAYSQTKPVEYPRTWEFYKSWEWTEIKQRSNELVMMMWSNFDGMTSSGRNKPFIHASIDPDWPSNTILELPEYLNNMNPSFFLTGNRSGGYWDKFEVEVIQSGKLKRIVDKHAKNAGLTMSIR